MKILKNINLVGAFIGGALFVVFLYHAFTVYQIRAVTIQNRADLDAIINLIKANSPDGSQEVSQPVSTPATEE